MRIGLMRTIQRVLLLSAAVVAPLGAQVTDTSVIRRTPTGWVLDFQQQNLRTILNALAEAGGLNLTMANVPDRRADLRIGQGLTREGVIEVLKGFAAAQGMRVTETPNLITVEGPPPGPSAADQIRAQQAAQLAAQQAAQVRLFTYRLKHASAIQLAPVLTNLFTGVLARPQATTIQTTPTGGFQILGPGTVNIPPAPATPRPPEPVVEFQVNPNRGGGAGNAGRGGGPGNQAARVGQAMAEVTERLSQVMGNLAQNQPGAVRSLSANANDIRIVAEESSNSLLIRATDQDYGLIQQILGTVDLRPLQVLIEVTIAEVTRTDDLNVGISGTVKRTPDGKTAPDATATLGSTASARDFVLQLSGGRGTIDFNVAINALATRGDLRVLSLPVIIAQNNRQAVLNVGSRRPFVQVTQAGGIDPSQRVETIQYLDVGTVLTITPTINPDGYVNLQVQQTANNATNEIAFDAPVISTREATTQVFVRDGQTTVIGGLADNSNRTQRSGIPILSRIPLIGWLFRGTEKNTSTSELFLFLTPHVVSSDEDIDRLREAVKDGSELLHQIPVGSRIQPKADTIPVPLVRPPVRDSLGRVRPPQQDAMSSVIPTSAARRDPGSVPTHAITTAVRIHRAGIPRRASLARDDRGNG
jgi:type II secretory pathway component GspD/PulD (secretin)